MMEGNCIFPFTYKDQVYNECFKGANGDWCATKVNKEGKMKRFAYCVYDEPKTKKKIVKKKIRVVLKKKIIIRHQLTIQKNLIVVK